MGPRLHLSCDNLTRGATNRHPRAKITALRDKTRDATRTLQGLDHIAHTKSLNGLISAISHQDGRPALDTNQVVRAAFEFLFVYFKLAAGQVDDATVAPPCVLLAVVAIAVADDGDVVIDPATRLGGGSAQ